MVLEDRQFRFTPSWERLPCYDIREDALRAACASATSTDPNDTDPYEDSWTMRVRVGEELPLLYEVSEDEYEDGDKSDNECCEDGEGLYYGHP